MTDYVVRIAKNGDVLTLYADDNPVIKNKIGKLKVKRASNVLFCEDTQKWYIHEKNENGEDYKHPYGYDKRSDAIKAEIMILHSKIAQDLNKSMGS